MEVLAADYDFIAGSRDRPFGLTFGAGADGN
jgi:hypothetical protein